MGIRAIPLIYLGTSKHRWKESAPKAGLELDGGEAGLFDEPCVGVHQLVD